jgi:ABC-2 type transport system permease protein
MTLSDIEERFTTPPVADRAAGRVVEAMAQSMTLAGRGLVRIRHSPHHLFDVVLLPIVFTVMFASLFGGAIAGDVDGYLPILVPGVLVQVVLAASVSTGVQLREDMNSGVYERFASMPIARVAPLVGSLAADVVRYAVAAAMTVVVGLVMGWRPESMVGVAVACVLVAVVAFAISWVFALLGVMLSTASSVQAVSMMILMPLTFMSNALVPVDTMPGWMQAFAGVNPVSHLVSAVREMSDGVYTAQIVFSLVGAAVVLIVATPVTVARYTRCE